MRSALLFVLIEARVAAPSELGGVAFATTEDLKHKLTQITGPSAGTLKGADFTLTVDDSSSGYKQKIDGFGAAWTDATVEVFDELSKADQESVLEDLFGESGIGIRFMRHSMGETDMSPKWIGNDGTWSFDVNNGKPDPNLAHFDITQSGEKMLSWLKRMFEKQSDILLLGTPWSPPAWMKNSSNQLQEQYVDAWAMYMVKYLQAAKAKGVKVDALTIQNEPLNSGEAEWHMLVTQQQASRYTNRLSSAIAAADLKTEIWAYDHNTDHPEYPAYVVENSPSVHNVAWHCYNSYKWSPMTDFYKAHPEIKQYMTECWNHRKVPYSLGTKAIAYDLFVGDESFFDLPRFIGGPVRNYASGALAWVLGGSSQWDVSLPINKGGCFGCSGIIQVDRKAKTYEKTQDYYTLGQFSKFVKTGATYLNGTEPSDNIESEYFRNPNGDLVVVISNQRNDGIDLQIDFKIAGSFHGFVPKRSVTTWVLSSSTPPAKPVKDSTCRDYCVGENPCWWTAQYSCPGQPRGSSGVAGDKGSQGYECCCGFRSCSANSQVQARANITSTVII